MPAPLLSAVGDAEPELPEDEADVAVAVSFEDAFDGLTIAVAGLVCEKPTDAVLSGEEGALDGVTRIPGTVPTV